MLSAGKRAEAAELHDAEIVPRFHELSVAIFNYREYTAMAESGAERHVMMLSQTVAANVGGIAQRVATMVMSKHGGQELHAELLALRKEYMAAFGELKSSEATAEGKRLLGQADQVAAR